MRLIPIKVWNRIEMLQQPIAAEVLAGDNRRRWLAIYPTISTAIAPSSPSLYSLLDSEFDAVRLAKEEAFGDEDLAITQQSRYYANSKEELYDLLSKLDVNPELFDAPWNVNYPL